MPRPFALTVLLAAALAGMPTAIRAQDPPPAAPAPALRPRPLAAGVLTVIPPVPAEDETFSGPLTLTEVVNGISNPDFKPNYRPLSDTIDQMARRVVLRRGVWTLEFSFKPLRMIDVDIPQQDPPPPGQPVKMNRKRIWYLVYRIRNTGPHFAPAAREDKFGHKLFGIDQVSQTVRFFPTFVLEGKVLEGDVYETKGYLDRVIPAAVKPIQIREDPATPLYDSVLITGKGIAPTADGVDNSVWGVATWEDLDPRINFFSIYVQGLTNAFRFEDHPDGTRTYQHKTLQLNFWRPGDAIGVAETEIRYGVPLDPDGERQLRILKMYGLTEPLDYLWIYR